MFLKKVKKTSDLHKKMFAKFHLFELDVNNSQN